MANNITGRTRLIALLGHPVSHSISPQMHNIAFDHLGLDYAYLAFDTKEKNLEKIVEAMKVLNVAGFNVTMPNKQSIMQFLDEVSKEAEWIGAVNTVHNDNGKLIGYNTDGKGYVQSLREENIDFVGKKIVIVGAGGAARAICIQLAIDGAGEIAILNRSLAKAKEIRDIISEKLSECSVSALEFNDRNLKEALEDGSILINATSLGMDHHEDKSILSDPKVLKRDLVVSDLIYKPDKTRLLKLAEAAGCKTINGFGMVIWQGAMAFKLWTGEDMPVDLVKTAIKAE